MSRGVTALLAALLCISTLIATLAATVVYLTGVSPIPNATFGSILWAYFGKTSSLPLDKSGGLAFMFIGMLVAFAGMFVGSTFIGAMGAAITGKLAELRKGRSLVVEQGHTVILGWSEHIFAIISELSAAWDHRGGGCIVILAPKDKVQMEDAVRTKVPGRGRTRVVCRTGNPNDPNDLAIANPREAAATIVLGSSAVDDPDAEVIKTVLALTSTPRRGGEKYHIVAEIRDTKNLRVIDLIMPGEVRPIVTDDLLARITVQTCRQAGLSVVYTELLDFAGHEIYLFEDPALVGKTFREALLAYETSGAVGIHRKATGVAFKPPLETQLAVGDRLMLLAENPAKILPLGRDGGARAQVSEASIRNASSATSGPEHTLILGWNRRAEAIVRELDCYVAPGSSVTIVSSFGEATAAVAGIAPRLRNLTAHVRIADTTDRNVLDSLDIPSYSHVITLSYADKLSVQAADSRTLITLLHLRDICRCSGREISIVSEMLDERNRDLAQVARADDFIVSDRLVSLMLSQIAENRDLNLTDLFDADGSELYLKSVADYVALDEAVNFQTVVEAAARRDEVAIGLRIAALSKDSARSYGVIVNPPKSQAHRFQAADRVLVLAEK